VTVVVPTIGRPELLAGCLDSLAACEPRAAEVLVIDQSLQRDVGAVVAAYEDAGARSVWSDERGVARGRNLGLEQAAHELVLVTDDDCVVSPDWIATAVALHERHPGALLTGRVLPHGDPRAVPSTIVSTIPHDYTGEHQCAVLYANNMVLERSPTLELGGFDPHVPNAEDNDFCYRWLRAGRRLRYEPALVVWHREWRSRVELERLYVDYGRGQAFLYAKHLRQGDLSIFRFVARELYGGVRGTLGSRLYRRPPWQDSRPAIFRGLATSFLPAWRAFSRR
jgi:GT2 family glycosyltransferase